MTPEELSPAERAAAAALGWYERQQKRGERLDPASAMLYQQLGAIYFEESRGSTERINTASAVATRKIWVPITVAEVRAGDVVRMPGKVGSERTVADVSPVMPWHVHPAANPYAPQEKRAEWSEVKVRFAGIAEPFSFTDPDFAVEIETTQDIADAVALLGGWGARA